MLSWWRIKSRSGKSIFEWPKPSQQQSDNRVRVIKQFVIRMLGDAIHSGSSAILLRADDKHFVIEYAMDGMIQERGREPIEMYPNVINVLKTMTGLNYWQKVPGRTGSLPVIVDNTKFDLKATFTTTEIGDEAFVEITRVSTSDSS